MDYIVKKNVMPAFDRDVESSLKFLQRIKERGIPERNEKGIQLKLGLEAIVRYSDLEDLDKIAENLKTCEKYPLSIHLPLNQQNPETVDLTQVVGYENARKIVKLAEEAKADFVVAHPNVLRSKEFFEQREYTEKDKEELFQKLVENVSALDKQSKNVRFTIENKPYPATDEKNEDLRYSRLCFTFDDLLKLKTEGIKQTFDTCHYAISRSTIHGVIATLNQTKKELKDLIKEKEMHGIFAEDLQIQPKTEVALDVLKDSVINVHLNDGTPYKNVNGMITYWEGLVPEEGSLVDYDVIRFSERKNPFSLVAEVYEQDYQNCPNAFKAFVNLFNRFYYNLS